MGVKGLYTYLRCYRHDIYTTTLPASQQMRIGFDAMSILYKYKTAWEDIFPLLKELKAAGHRLLFVFDGKPPVEKEEEVATRREARQAAGAQATALKEYLAVSAEPEGSRERKILEYSVARLEHQGWHMTREIRHEVQRRLWDEGIPYVKGTGEADAVLADLVGAGKLDVVVSTDMDFLLSGVPRLWIPFRKAGDGFEEIVLSEVLEGEGLTAEGLRDAGILCGVEPLRGKVSVNPHTAFSWLRYYKTMEALLQSSIQDDALLPLQDAATLARVREHFQPQAPWQARIREDHLARFQTFLDTL